MDLGTPYTVCGGSAASGAGAALQVTASTSTRQGDALVAVFSGNSGSGLPTTSSLTDSQGNTWTNWVLDTTRSPSLGIYVALNCAPLVSGTDWVKGTASGSPGAKSLIVRACSGIAQVSAVDTHVVADASTGTGPSSGSSGALAQALEWAVAAIANGSGGGTPSSWTGGFTAALSESPGPITTLADQIVASTAALTAGATIVSSTWTCGLVTLKAAAVPVPFLSQQSGMF